jgi:hippurate hydrolase
MRRYPPTINDANAVEFAAKVAEEVCGKGKLDRSIRPLMGGEDFSFMLQKVPGAMFWIGNGAGEGSCIIHNPHYDFNNEILPLGASFFARLVETYLEKKAA